MDFSRHKRAKVYDKYDGRCAYCGELLYIYDFHVDHIHPKSLGGNDGIENLNPSCKTCNIQKRSRTISEFRYYLQQGADVLCSKNAIFRSLVKFGTVTTIKEITFHFEKQPLRSNSLGAKL